MGLQSGRRNIGFGRLQQGKMRGTVAVSLTLDAGMVKGPSRPTASAVLWPDRSELPRGVLLGGNAPAGHHRSPTAEGGADDPTGHQRHLQVAAVRKPEDLTGRSAQTGVVRDTLHCANMVTWFSISG